MYRLLIAFALTSMLVSCSGTSDSDSTQEELKSELLEIMNEGQETEAVEAQDTTAVDSTLQIEFQADSVIAE